MSKFLLDNYILLTHSVEAMAALAGVFFIYRYKNTETKYFIFFLIYLTICDMLNWYTLFVYPDKILSFLVGSLIERSYWWGTLFWNIGAIMFFSFYYNKVLLQENFKKIIKYSSYLFLSFSIIYILFNLEDFFRRFIPVISVLGAIIIFLCAIFYFIELLQSDRILTFYKSINFYISVAIFIWWLIITPIVFYDIYMSKRDWNFIFLRREIYLFSNILMYSTFTFALIFCKPKKQL